MDNVKIFFIIYYLFVSFTAAKVRIFPTRARKGSEGLFLSVNDVESLFGCFYPTALQVIDF